MIEATGILTSGDYVRAQYLHIRPRLAYKILGVLILALFTWAAWFSFASENTELLDLFFVVAIVFLILNFAVYLPWKTRRIYKQQKALQRELAFVFDEDGVSVSSQNGQSVTPWDDYLKWKQNDQLILIYLSDCMYHMLPKGLFVDPADFDRVRDLLREHIGKAAG